MIQPSLGAMKTLSSFKTNGRTQGLRHGLLSASLLAAALLFISPTERVHADGGDFSLNLKAADSSTYDHTAGGGAWNDGGQGNTSESLDTKKDNFVCGDTVSYLIEVVVDDGALGTQSIDINMDFAKETTGQPGVSFSSISNVEINYNPDLLSGATVDTAIDDDGGSSVTWSVVDDGTDLNLAMTVDDLEAGETVIVRIDAVISCVHNSDPTGNLQASIDSANITGDVTDQVNFGQETISLKVHDIDTPILVSRFDAYSNGSAGWIKWSTAWEVGALAYQVERQANPADPDSEWLRIHPEEWLPFSIFGLNATYILEDNSLQPGDIARYRIIEQAEEPLIYGPFDVVVAEVDTPQPESGIVQRKRSAPLKGDNQQTKDQNTVSQAEKNTLNSNLTAGASAINGTPIVKVAVTEEGIQRISTASLALQFGVTEKEAGSWLKKGQFALTTDDGQRVAWSPYKGDLLFYGEAIPETHWNTARYYWLEADAPGQNMPQEVLHNHAGNVLTDYQAEATYDVTTHGTVAGAPVTFFMGIVDDPYIFMGAAWNLSNGAIGQHTFSIQKDQNAVDLPATLTMSGTLPFHTNWVTAGEESVISIAINGQHVDEVSYTVPPERTSGSTNFDFIFDIPGHFLQETDLDITMSVESVAQIAVYSTAYKLRYRRAFVADDAAIQFTPDSPGSARITGFPSSEPLVALNVTNPLQPVWLKSGNTSGEIEASFETDNYVIASESGWYNPELSPQEPAPVVNDNTDYLIVSAQSLLGGASELANYRSDLVSSIVSIESIYDHVTSGNPNPEALRIFLKSLPQKPHYVVLLGSGNLDYKDRFDFGGNLISPMLVNTETYLSSYHIINYDDSQFADFDDDFRPDLSIGRIPARNPEELSRYIDKLRSFESSGFGQHPDLVVTDSNSVFREQGEILANGIDGDVNRLHVSDLGYAETKSQLLAQLESGLSTISYLGHSGAWTLARLGFFLQAEDAQTMTNTRLPILVSLGCYINNFATLGNPELALLVDAFMLDNEHGIIASFGSTEISETGKALRMGLAFHEALETADRLGDAVLPAISNHEFVQFGYGLLGDPALKLR